MFVRDINYRSPDDLYVGPKQIMMLEPREDNGCPGIASGLSRSASKVGRVYLTEANLSAMRKMKSVQSRGIFWLYFWMSWEFHVSFMSANFTGQGVGIGSFLTNHSCRTNKASIWHRFFYRYRYHVFSPSFVAFLARSLFKIDAHQPKQATFIIGG